MSLNLSWDLFIIVIFAVVIAYSFIIGKNRTLKVVIGTYIAILAADGLGNLFRDYLLTNRIVIKLFSAFGIPGDDKALIIIKVLVFIIAIVILSIKGGFLVDIEENRSTVVNSILNLIFGFLSAGLVVSTLLVFISGVSFVLGEVTISTPTAVIDLYNNSRMIRLMIDNYNIWFSLPAIALVVTSYFSKPKEVIVEEA